jgi:serine/threonine protein kinase
VTRKKKAWKQRWGDFFEDDGEGLVVGKKIAEGAQAEIFTAYLKDDDGRKWEGVMKVFKEGSALQDLKKQWPKGMLRKSRVQEGMYFYYNTCLIYGGLLLKNGRFGFWMRRYWGDLRKLIDVRMQHNRNTSSPFTCSEAMRIMYSIAMGMQQLHEDKIIHKDLKAANILVQAEHNNTFNPLVDDFNCVVADFECSIGVVGTGYWRAPEILQALKNRSLKSHSFSEKSDVYSYAMTCYEVLSGCIPFEEFGGSSCHNIVIGGKRPKLPGHISPYLKTLLNKCWHPIPSCRPSFVYIAKQLEPINSWRL